MPKHPLPADLDYLPGAQRHCRRRRCGKNDVALGIQIGAIDVGLNLRALRTARGLSLRSLADQSGLNINTLSLIENGKTSPSVGTLQQLATTLQVPIKTFFEDQHPEENIAYQKAGRRPQAWFCHAVLEDLSAGLTLHGEQPFLITLEPWAGSGQVDITHTGLEFVYCLEGQLIYTIAEQDYRLGPGDSLLFEARLPHCWQNAGDTPVRSLLVMCPADESDQPIKRHFEHSTTGQAVIGGAACQDKKD